MGFGLVILFSAHLHLEISSSYNFAQITITCTCLLSLLQPSNKGYSSCPFSSRTALPNCRLKTHWHYWRLDCCWSVPEQWFLVLSPTVLMTIFYSLMALGNLWMDHTENTSSCSAMLQDDAAADTDCTEDTNSNSSSIIAYKRTYRHEMCTEPLPSNGRVCRVVS